VHLRLLLPQVSTIAAPGRAIEAPLNRGRTLETLIESPICFGNTVQNGSFQEVALTA
jgi:hypothetical protein